MYRIGLIGNRAHQNSYGPRWAERDDCEIVALAEHNPEKAKALEKLYALTCSLDYDAVFERDDVDIVCIATDFYLKRNLIRKAVECGKHILVDKPIARTVREAKEIVAVTEEADVKVHLAYPARFEPGFRLLLQRLKDGTYRRPVSYTQHFIRQFQDGDLMQYVSYPTEARVNGGGELMNLGSHPVDLIQKAFGLPRRVYCHFETAYWPDFYDQFGTEDAATLLCEYDEFTASAVTGRNRFSEENSVTSSIDVWCEGAYLHASPKGLSENGNPVDVPIIEATGGLGCVQNLIDAISGVEEIESGPLDGLAIAELTTAGYQSAASGQFIDLPLQDERHPMISEDEQVVDGFLD